MLLFPRSNQATQNAHTPWALFGFTVLFGVMYWQRYSEIVPMLHIGTRGLGANHVNIFSQEYFTFLIDKPNGYPVFLFLVKSMVNSKEAFVDAVILFQLVFFLLSAWYLSLQFYYFSNRRSLSSALLFLILGNPEIIKFCFLVMTESFMMSLLMLVLGLGCRWAQQTQIKDQQRTLLWMSLCLGAAILIRPICYAWIIALATVLILFYGRALFTWRARLRTLQLFCIPLFLCWALGVSFHGAVFGFEKKGAFLNHLVLGKVAMTLDKQDWAAPPPFIKSILDIFDPIHTVINQADIKTQYTLAVIYTDVARLSLPMFRRLYNEQDIHDQITQAFIYLLRHHPLKYLKDVGLHYTAMWQFWDLMTPEDIHHFVQFSETHAPLPYIHSIGSIQDLTPMYALKLELNDYTTWPPFLRVIRTLMGLICLITLGFFGRTLWCLRRAERHTQLTAPLWAGLLSAALIQATYLMTAAVNTAAFRYAMVMWPAIALVGILPFLLFRGTEKPAVP